LVLPGWQVAAVRLVWLHVLVQNLPGSLDRVNRIGLARTGTGRVIGTRRHSRRRQRIRGTPVAGPVEVIWFKRRFFWDEPECPRRTFFEATTEVPRLARSTRRLQNTLVSAVIESGRAATEAAAAYGVSWWLVQRAPDTAAARPPDVDRLRLSI
jgi:hypothetical protein